MTDLSRQPTLSAQFLELRDTQWARSQGEIGA